MSASKKINRLGKPNEIEKENFSLRVNYSPRKDKKFSYNHSHEEKPLRKYLPVEKNNQPAPAMDEIEMLRKELKQEREKVKYLETRTIKEQCNVLQHLEMLEGKFQEISAEKHHLEMEMQKMRGQPMNRHMDEEEVDWKERFQELDAQHKKVKKIADGLIDMMKKVDGVEGNLKDAWRWVKKIVWEYEGIRKKALQWKQVYDQVTQAVGILDKKPLSA